jgi:Glycosyl transferase family 8
MGALSPAAARLLVCGCAVLSIAYSALTSKSLHQVDPALAQRKAAAAVRVRRPIRAGFWTRPLTHTLCCDATQTRQATPSLRSFSKFADAGIDVFEDNGNSTELRINEKYANVPLTDTVLIVIISDRKDGIIPTISSILMTSTQPVDVVLIGRYVINEEVKTHFGNRINMFTSLSVQDVTSDLQKAGHKPIWTWPDWHTSINNPAWRNKNTLHVGPWDNLHTHAHELNHVRFYLPHLSIFKNKQYFYFLDDDLLIRKDLSVLAIQTLSELGKDKGLVGPCNIWMWNSDCFHFEFQSQKDYILEMPSLYGDRQVCQTQSESHCVPENYWDFVRGQMPATGKEQHAWNFGFSLFALENWRSLDLTAKYEKVMKESYRLHVFPETSLTFGLGVAYIAFAGAVECWNEDNVHVRDGFGFIELDRFEQTFGKDFLETTVDVMHFTGPDKPWVPESRIEPWAVKPWLDMMKKEKMSLPPQLPENPTENLFTVLASEFTGVEYIMSKLDQHPEVCASGEMDKPETGFPVDSLHPEGLGWFPACSTKKGCTFAFVNQSLVELLSEMTADGSTPQRCAKAHDKSNDPLGYHLHRLCNFAKQMSNVYDGELLARLWVGAFVSENKDLLGCGCNRGTKAKGLKVLPEWVTFDTVKSTLPPLNLNASKVHGSKIIRLKRRNLWARYKSMMIAIQTGSYHVSSPAEKKTQLEALESAGNLTLDIDHLDWHMQHMQRMDQAGDTWARDRASEILWLEYEDCIEDTVSCFGRIYNFVGVDVSRMSKSKEDLYAAMMSTYDNVDDSMDYVTNAVEIREKMALHGWDRFISNERHHPIQLLLYNDNEMLVDTRRYLGINATIYGTDGAGKFPGAISMLHQMSPEAMVVLGDLSSSWVSFPLGGHNITITALANFRSSFDAITKGYPGAVVASSETQCCASSLSHVSPGDLVDANKKRSGRSCVPGEPGCEWKDESKAIAWQSMMQNLAKERSGEANGRDFLDAGLMAGKAGDLLSLLEMADIQKTEDDRAVLADILYRNPGMLVLDSEERLFGESALALGHDDSESCLAATSASTAVERRLGEGDSKLNTLFMRRPRGHGCRSSESESISVPTYPAWDGDGIQVTSVLNHINRVIAVEDIVVLREDYRQAGNGLDYRQGPEIPYIFDDSGVWTSRLIRDRTDNSTFHQRLLHSEKLTMRAHNLLLSEGMDSPRWPVLKRSIRTGGIPFWSWYGDFKICNHHNHKEESIPVFTTCARVDCKHAYPVSLFGRNIVGARTPILN